MFTHPMGRQVYFCITLHSVDKWPHDTHPTSYHHPKPHFGTLVDVCRWWEQTEREGLITL